MSRKKKAQFSLEEKEELLQAFNTGMDRVSKDKYEMIQKMSSSRGNPHAPNLVVTIFVRMSAHPSASFSFRLVWEVLRSQHPKSPTVLGSDSCSSVRSVWLSKNSPVFLVLLLSGLPPWHSVLDGDHASLGITGNFSRRIHTDLDLPLTLSTKFRRSKLGLLFCRRCILRAGLATYMYI